MYLNKLREFGYQIGILRPAFISGNSITGCSNTDDFVWKYIRLLVNNGMSPKDQTMILTPVELVANIFANSIETLPNVVNLLPITNSNIGYICQLIGKKIEKKIEDVTMDEMKQKIIQLAMNGNKEVMALLPSLQMNLSNIMEMNYVKENNINVSESNESLEKSVDYLIKSGFFGEEFADGKTKGIGRAMN